jgi:hypothetical protein
LIGLDVLLSVRKILSTTISPIRSTALSAPQGDGCTIPWAQIQSWW